MHRGNIEGYFKYRYSFFKFPVGTLTEYFWFLDDEAKKILSDLRRMGAKALTSDDLAILEGVPSRIEQRIIDREIALEIEEREERRSQAIRTGMERAKAWGQHVGRPKGTGESDEEFLAKESSQRAIAALKEGLSLRKAAEVSGLAVNTVRKVKELMEDASYK